MANPVREVRAASAFKNWHAFVAELRRDGAESGLVCGACIWKIVKSGLCRSGCKDGAGRKRGRRRLDYAELFFLYVLPEV